MKSGGSLDTIILFAVKYAIENIRRVTIAKLAYQL